MTEQDLGGGLGLDAELVEHGERPLGHALGPLLVVGAEGGGDGQPVGPFRVGIEGEGPLGVDQGVRGLAPHEAQLAQLEQAVELQQADPLDLVVLAGTRRPDR